MRNSSPDSIRNQTIIRPRKLGIQDLPWLSGARQDPIPRLLPFQEAIRSISSHYFLAAWLCVMALIGYICKINARQSTVFKFGTIVTCHHVD